MNQAYPSSTVNFLGQGRATVLYTVNNLPIILGQAIVQQGLPGFSDFIVNNIQFEGPNKNTVTVPTRARTITGPTGAEIGVDIFGSLTNIVGDANTYNLVMNVIMRNCYITNTTSLPLRLFGVTGVCRVVNCQSYNTMDYGFGFNQEVICIGNHSFMSADNGFSLSRANNKVTCTGNTVEISAYDGLWLSGYDNTDGPKELAIVGNVIVNNGERGISLANRPNWGVVTGNFINKNFNRGASDQGQDTNEEGISLIGDASNNLGTVFNITGNTIFQAPSAGIFVEYMINVLIASNLIVNTGTHNLANGTTILSNSLSQNIGILVADSNSTFISIMGNMITDTRSPNFMNLGIYVTPGAANVVTKGNVLYGYRNTSNPIYDQTTATLQITAGLGVNRVAVADANYTGLSTDGIIGFTALTAPRTYTLPDATQFPTGMSQLLLLKDEVGLAATYNITANTVNGQTIDGASTKVLSANGGNLKFYSDGANWHTY